MHPSHSAASLILCTVFLPALLIAGPAVAPVAGVTAIAGITANSSTSSAPGVAEVAVATSRLINFSVRANAGIGEQTLVVGFTTGGAGVMQTLVRCVGPTLMQFGFTDTNSDPELRLFNGTGVLVCHNDNWGGDLALKLAFSLVGAFALPFNSRDAAFAPVLATGAYTALASGVPVVAGAMPPTGTVLLEVYDAGATASDARLVNLSARNQVGIGENVLIAGFVIAGNAPKTFLIRGVGPGLTPFGVTGALVDPKLSVFDAKGLVIAQNDDWGGTAALSSAATQAGAFALPASSKDAAVIVTLLPGAYTAQVGGVSGMTGVGLIELYELQP